MMPTISSTSTARLIRLSHHTRTLRAGAGSAMDPPSTDCPQVYADRLAEGGIARYAARLYPDATPRDLRVRRRALHLVLPRRRRVRPGQRARPGPGPGARSPARSTCCGPAAAPSPGRWARCSPTPGGSRTGGCRPGGGSGSSARSSTTSGRDRGGPQQGRGPPAGRRRSTSELRRATSAAYVAHAADRLRRRRAACPARSTRHSSVREFSAAGNDLLLLVQRPAVARPGRGGRRRAQPGAWRCATGGRSAARRGGGAGPRPLARRTHEPTCRRCDAAASADPRRAPVSRRRRARRPRHHRLVPRVSAPADRAVRSELTAERRGAANANRAMPTKPLAVKKARFTRDRSVGVHDRRAGSRTPPRSAPGRPTTASRGRPARRTRRTARTSPRAPAVDSRSANGTP